MRRLLIAACALLVLAALVAGVAVSTRLGPERVRAELVERLAAELGPVEIDAVRPHFGWGVGIEIAGLRSLPEPDGAGIAADRVWITLSPRSLLRGEPIARRIDARGVRVRAVQATDGSWRPAVVARLVERLAARSDAAHEPTPGGDTDLRAFAKALPRLSIDDGALVVVRGEGATARQLALADLRFELTHDPLGGGAKASTAARLVEDEHERGRFEINAKIEANGPHLEAALVDVDLAALAPWLPLGGVHLEAAGHASGTASWKPQQGGGALVVDLLGFDVRLAGRLREGDTDLSHAIPNARLRAALVVDPQALRLTEFEWSAEPTSLRGSASLDRPFDDAAKLGFELHGAAVPVATLRDLLLAIAPRSSNLRERAGALRAGELESFTVRAGPTPIAAWRAFGSAPLEAWPSSLELETRVDDIELGLGASDPLRDLDALVRMRDDRIQIEGAHARIGTRPLPSLRLSLTGLRAVAAAIQGGELPPPVAPLPGRIALDDWVDSHRRPGAPPRWKRIDVDADWIEHPALLRPIEEMTASLTPANPGVHIEDAKGFWGGVPFRGNISFRGGAGSSVEADLTLSLPRREGRRRSETKVWGRAKFHADLEKLGDFQAEQLSGVVQAVGDRIELRHGEATLRPRGDVSGIVDLDLSHTDSVPYHAQIALENGSLSELMNDLKMDGGSANGTANLDTELTGELIPFHDLLADSSGPATLRLRDGEILKRMNFLFSIAQASDTLNPFRSRDTIPYERIDAPLKLAGGWASTDALSLQGPALRLVGTGRVNVVVPPHDVEAVIGIFYFRALDRVIGVLPILNRWLLGPDENLVSTYFAVSGPWGNPQASIIPSKSIASGPGSFVLEGLPSFVRGGLATLEHLFVAPEAGAKSGPAPTPSPVPPFVPPSAMGDAQ